LAVAASARRAGMLGPMPALVGPNTPTAAAVRNPTRATVMVVRNATRITGITHRPIAATARLALAQTINGTSTVAMAVQVSSPADSVAVAQDNLIAPAVVVPAGADNGSQALSLAL
jgi:hypothetical protein